MKISPFVYHWNLWIDLIDKLRLTICSTRYPFNEFSNSIRNKNENREKYSNESLKTSLTWLFFILNFFWRIFFRFSPVCRSISIWLLIDEHRSHLSSFVEFGDDDKYSFFNFNSFIRFVFQWKCRIKSFSLESIFFLFRRFRRRCFISIWNSNNKVKSRFDFKRNETREEKFSFLRFDHLFEMIRWETKTRKSMKNEKKICLSSEVRVRGSQKPEVLG